MSCQFDDVGSECFRSGCEMLFLIFDLHVLSEYRICGFSVGGIKRFVVPRNSGLQNEMTCDCDGVR